MLADSHCHLDRLDLTAYGGELALALEAARDNGVTHFLCACIDLEHFGDVLGIAQAYDNIVTSVGVHPNEVPDQVVSEADLLQHLDHPRVVAVGETGLDYHWNEGDLTWQQERFRVHIRAAKQSGKPLIVHSRQAKADTLRLLKEEGAEQVGGVMHCFTEDWAMAQAALDLGFYIGFSGIVTFTNAAMLREVAQKMPLDRLLVETDSPYLAPVPHRGKPNEPAYVRFVAEAIALLRGLSYEKVAAQTTENYCRLFKC